MFKSQKYVFLNALILAVFIFGVGIALGYWFEGLRVAKINNLYTQAELNLLDIKILSDYTNYNISCENAIQNNIDFGNKVYEEAKILEDYENAERISESIKIQHYKYDLLRTLFFINSLKIKKQCNAGYHNIVYFYKYESPDLDTKAKQKVFSNILLELKRNQSNRIMLIPIAGDISFSSVKLLTQTYNITQLPTIMIDEKIKITDIESVQEIESLLR